MEIDHYTYRVTWSAEDGEHVGLCAEFPSVSWLAATPGAALAGARALVARVAADLQANGETIPTPVAERRYSGEPESTGQCQAGCTLVVRPPQDR